MDRIDLKKPEIIQRVGFDFSWDETKVWALEYPTVTMSRQMLDWHLDVPFLSTSPDGYYDLFPRSVIDNPEEYPEEYQRVLQCDTGYAIDIMFWRKNWLILDGLHRLMRFNIEGIDDVQVRKIPNKAIPFILKEKQT
jgi:hypothetical protein